jgi:O-succinylhomoserine sulfhydrylase
MSKSKNPLSDPRTARPETQLVHGGTQRSQFNETSEAIFLNSGYSYPNSQYAEDLFLNKINKGAQLLALLQPDDGDVPGPDGAARGRRGRARLRDRHVGGDQCGDEPGAGRRPYRRVEAAVRRLSLCGRGPDAALRRALDLVDGRDPRTSKRAMQKNTKVVFIETPDQSDARLVDIEAVAQIAKAHGAKLIVDNVFATAMLQKPLHSAPTSSPIRPPSISTARAGLLGGVVLGSKALIEGDVHTLLRQTGPSLSPFNAWVLLKGVETLPLRVRQMTENAAKVADFLATTPRSRGCPTRSIQSHPQYELAKRQMASGSTLVAFEVKGGREAAFRLSDSLAVILISNNLGDAKSLITHPGTTTHARFTEEVRLESGITPGLLRISVGLEESADLIADLAYGLDQI